MNLNKLINLLVNVIVIVSAIIIIYWAIELLFGGSPTLTEFNFLLIVMVMGILFKLYRELGEIKVGIKHSVTNIRSDINLIKSKMNL
mgnify:CR=1 FL=1